MRPSATLAAPVSSAQGRHTLETAAVKNRVRPFALTSFAEIPVKRRTRARQQGSTVYSSEPLYYAGRTKLEVNELRPPARRPGSIAPTSGVGIWNGAALQRGHMGMLCTNWLSVASGRLLRNSHSSMHALWKQCPQGRSFSSSPRVYATKQIEHSSSRDLSEHVALACSAGRLMCTRGSVCSSMAVVAL